MKTVSKINEDLYKLLELGKINKIIRHYKIIKKNFNNDNDDIIFYQIPRADLEPSGNNNDHYSYDNIFYSKPSKIIDNDYNRDLDFAKCAYIEGLETSYIDKTTGKKHYLSLDVNSFVNSDYSTTVRNNGKEMDKIQQLKQSAFSAAQNGDLESALAAIQGDNVAAISDNIRQFSEIRRQHEEQMKQMDQAIQEQANQMKLQEIATKGEQDRQTLALKAQYDLQLEYAKGDIALLGDTNPQNDDYAKTQLAKLQEESKRASEAAKLQLERQKLAMDAYNKAADRQVKREEMANQLKIAKTNKNKYDKK